MDEAGVAAADRGDDAPVEVCFPAGGDCIGLMTCELPFVETAAGFLPHADAGALTFEALGADRAGNISMDCVLRMGCFICEGSALLAEVLRGGLWVCGCAFCLPAAFSDMPELAVDLKAEFAWNASSF